MVEGKRTTRNGVPGKLVYVAPKEGYHRFVPDTYHHHRDKTRKR